MKRGYERAMKRRRNSAEWDERHARIMLIDRVSQTDLDEFFVSYLQCALWASSDESEYGGDPLDENYEIEDIDFRTLCLMLVDCWTFAFNNSDDLETVRDAIDDSRAGYDFWLTRNHHGAGFQDEGGTEEEAAAFAALTRASHDYGEYWLYVGDDRETVYGDTRATATDIRWLFEMGLLGEDEEAIETLARLVARGLSIEPFTERTQVEIDEALEKIQ